MRGKRPISAAHNVKVRIYGLSDRNTHKGEKSLVATSPTQRHLLVWLSALAVLASVAVGREAASRELKTPELSLLVPVPVCRADADADRLDPLRTALSRR